MSASCFMIGWRTVRRTAMGTGFSNVTSNQIARVARVD